MGHLKTAEKTPKVGDEGIATSGKITVSATNDVGGTTTLPKGQYRVRITKIRSDYECGLRMKGELIDPKQVEISRKAGTTGFTAAHYRKSCPSNPGMAMEVEKAQKAFDPKMVYFGESNFRAL